MYIPGWLIFLIIGLPHALFYTINRVNIFDWHPNPDEPIIVGSEIKYYENRRLLKEKLDNIKKAPMAWKVEHFLHVFTGVVIGWVCFWILLDKRINIFGQQNFSNLNLGDLVLFLLGWIGINGRLPSIAHAIVDFMKSGISIGK